MEELKRNQILQSISDLCNLLINSTPADGPMIRGVLMVSLLGIDGSGVEITGYDKEKLDHLNNVYDQLCAGKFNILPAYQNN